MRPAIALAILITLPAWLHESNSHADAARGTKQYTQQQYSEAVRSFDRAQKAAPSARGAFNLGTAEVAAGKRPEGSAQLTQAMKDPALKADALYNRGNSALAANAYDYAIRDYIETLKLRPKDAAAKRNLEIAMTKKRASQQAAGGKGGGAGGQQPQQQKGQQPSPQKPQKNGEADTDALLRSVQQQEQEELSRMRRFGREPVRVGW